MNIQMVPRVLRNPLTSVRFLHTGESVIFCTLVSFGNRPSSVHLWPTTNADCVQIFDLRPEKVLPACLINSIHVLEVLPDESSVSGIFWDGLVSSVFVFISRVPAFDRCIIDEQFSYCRDFVL